VPLDQAVYSQDRAVRDAVAVLDAVGLGRAHVVGLSMGGFCALHLGLNHPERVTSLVVAGCGYGAQPDQRDSFRAECEVLADAFATEGAAWVAEGYAEGPARVQFQAKDRIAWEEFKRRLAAHSPEGAALTMRGVQARRPSLYALTDQLGAMTVPTLIVTGDEDERCLEPDIMLKRTIPSAALLVLPKTGHTCNLEEPERFNQAVSDFIACVETGRWTLRDPRSLATSRTGIHTPGRGFIPFPAR
jgi:pimeloyl-ACP methyl ester carboxylesterase